ncbi:unnamed protein product [Dicrocoelium dendriticum]|nr:unnamed protein product [Dicrocoelium dendriticum]
MLPYLYAVALLFFLLLTTVGFFIIASGLLYKIAIRLQAPPHLLHGALFAYKHHYGKLDDAGYLFTEAHYLAPECVQCGIKYGDEIHDESLCKRSVVGAFLTEDLECRRAFEQAGYQFAQLPPVREALVASFPHISFLSILIGSKRSYQHLNTHISELHLKVNTYLEIYDDRWIHYVALITDEEQFVFPPDEDRIPPDAAPSLVLESLDSDAVGTPKPIVTSPDEPRALLIDGHNKHLGVQSADDSDDSADAKELEASFEKIIDISGIPVGKG